MPIRKSATRGFHKHHAGGGKAFRQIAPGPRIGTLNLNVAEMRLTIGAGIQIVDAHRDPSLFNLGAALVSLGEQESGTAHLTEAVAAYRAALHC